MEAEADREAGTRLPVVAVLVLAVALTGCAGGEQVAQAAADASGCTDASGAQNNPGDFQYGGAASCKTETETFEWDNPSPYARVQYGSGLAEGRIGITISDAADRTVYEGSVDASAEGRQERTDAGFPSSPAGTWTIEIEFQNVTGTLGIQVQSVE